MASIQEAMQVDMVQDPKSLLPKKYNRSVRGLCKIKKWIYMKHVLIVCAFFKSKYGMILIFRKFFQTIPKKHSQSIMFLKKLSSFYQQERPLSSKKLRHPRPISNKKNEFRTAFNEYSYGHYIFLKTSDFPHKGSKEG